MTRIHVLKFAAAAFVTLGLGVGLSGCINVLPKTKPVQLYRFSYAPASIGKEAAPAPGTVLTPVNLGQIDFPQEASGDRVTTTEANEVTYVAGSRWAAPAKQLFSEAVREGFSRSATTVRLDPRGPVATQYRLDLSVHKFESAYARGKPTVMIAMDARVIRLSDRAVVGQRYVTAEVPVRRNDMSMMAEAYDTATSKAVAELVGFTQETVAANPLPDTKVTVPPPPPPPAK